MNKFVKICTACNKNFSTSNIDDFKKYFHKAKLGKYGFAARCKDCRHKLEILPNREKRAEYDRNRREIIVYNNICIVCNKSFVAKREDIKCCSKECRKFKKKVQNRLYQPKYRLIVKKRRSLELKRENRRKVYTKEEIEYISRRLDFGAKRIAKKLKRTTYGVSKIIHKLKKRKGIK